MQSFGNCAEMKKETNPKNKKCETVSGADNTRKF